MERLLFKLLDDFLIALLLMMIIFLLKIIVLDDLVTAILSLDVEWGYIEQVTVVWL